jgi:hypothetical protein
VSVELGTTNADLFHTSTGVAYADLLSDGKETWPIRSERFRWWLRGNYYDATGMAPSAGAIRSVLDLLEPRAQFDGHERPSRMACDSVVLRSQGMSDIRGRANGYHGARPGLKGARRASKAPAYREPKR